MDVYVENFDGYEILGSGDGRKLERFGNVILDRPCPQAIWPRDKSAPWKKAKAVFQRGEGGIGDWSSPRGSLPQSWWIELRGLTMELRLTGFGNVGIFPEHFAHVDWLTAIIKKKKQPRILNLFAYTGGLSMICAKAGAEVIHLDAAKSVNAWAIFNATQSKMPKDSMRFIADDAIKFASREIRRSGRYDGIIIDPPTFGRGTKGEVWKIERDLHPLMSACSDLLTENPLFMLLTCHSPGLMPSTLKCMVSGLNGRVESGEMLLKGAEFPIPSGIFARWIP